MFISETFGSSCRTMFLSKLKSVLKCGFLESSWLHQSTYGGLCVLDTDLASTDQKAKYSTTLGAEYFSISDERALNTLKTRTCYYPKFQKINVATWIQWNSTHFPDTTKTKDIHIKVILFSDILVF